MTDFEFEVKEKKQLARSARYKVNGSKSRKCTLATDYMTPSQIRKMNGEMVTYNINKPMTLEEFKRLPPDIGKEFIIRLVDLYGCNYSSLSEMFGCSRNTCAKLLAYSPYEIRFDRGCAMSRAKRERWYEFIGRAENGQCREVFEPEIPKEEEPVPDVSTTMTQTETEMKSDKPSQMSMTEFSLNFSGRLSVEAIANSLRLILGDGMDGSLSIKCYLGGDSNGQQ